MQKVELGSPFRNDCSYLFWTLQRVTPLLQQVSQCFGFKTSVRMRDNQMVASYTKNVVCRSHNAAVGLTAQKNCSVYNTALTRRLILAVR